MQKAAFDVAEEDSDPSMPSSVDLDEVMREMKEHTLPARIAHAVKDSSIGLANFVFSNKLLLSIGIFLLVSVFGGIYAWQTFYPQYLKTQAIQEFEEQNYESALDSIAKYRDFHTGDDEIAYISALSNFKLQRFEKALLEIQILSSLDTDLQTDVDFTFYRALTSHKDIDDALTLVSRSLEAEPTHLPSILLRALYGAIAVDSVSEQFEERHIRDMLNSGSEGAVQYGEQIRIMLTYISKNSKALFPSLKADLSPLFKNLGGDSDQSGFVDGFHNSYSLALDGLYDGSVEIDVDVAVRTIMLLALINRNSTNDQDVDDISSQLRADFSANPSNSIAGYLVAALYMQRRDFEAATKLYERINELNPTDPNTLLNLVNARLQVTPENFRIALDDYNAVISVDPQNTVALNNRGFLNLWFTENINKAKHDFEEALRLDSESLFANYNLGQAYLKTAEPRKAITAFTKVVDASSSLGNVLLYRGIANRLAGEFEYAIKDFNDFKLVDPQNVVPYIQSAELFGSSAGYKLALNELQTAMDFRPDSQRLAIMLADFYLRADQPNNTEKVLEAFPDLDSGNLEHKLIDGRLQFAKGNLFRAEQTLKEVYEAYSLQSEEEADPEKTLQAAVHYLQVLQDRDKLEEILELTRTLLPNHPDNLELLSIRAMAFNQQGNSSEALRFAQRAVEIDPLSFEIQIVLGDAFSSSGRFQEAMEAYRTGQKIRPAELSALYKMENLLDLLNEADELKVIRDQIARVESEQLLVRESEQVLSSIQEPSSGAIGDSSITSEAQIAQLRGSIEEVDAKIKDNPDSGVLYYNRGVIEMSIGDINAATTSMKTAVTKDPGNIDFMMGLATAHLRTNNYKQAIQILTEIIELNEDNFEAVYNRAVAHHNSGDNEAAIVDYTSAVRLNPAYASAYYNRGTIYVAFAEYYRAIEEFTRVIELWPNDVKPYLARAQVYRLVGENDSAEGDMQAAQLLRASQESQNLTQ